MNSRKDLTKEQIQEALDTTLSLTEACVKAGCCRSTLFRKCQEFGISWKRNQSGRGISKPRKYQKPEDVFREGLVPGGTLSTFLKQEREWKCECCGLSEWQGKRLPLEIHHIDGNHTNNSRDNLQILCPNCHAQTDNWRARNTRKTVRVSDVDFLKALENSNSISQALQKLGLSGGANYYRAKKLLQGK